MMLESVLQTAGRTPLVKLRRSPKIQAGVYLKLESQNPAAASGPHRVAMIADAERAVGCDRVAPSSSHRGQHRRRVGDGRRRQRVSLHFRPAR